MTREIRTESGGKVYVKTNRQPRDLLAYYQLTAEQRDWVDYMGPLDEDNDEHYTPRFFIYRGSVYDAHEFQSNAPTDPPDWVRVAGFDAWETESAFSAVLLTYFQTDGHLLDDQVVVGYAHW